jgi:hypothetical protein
MNDNASLLAKRALAPVALILLWLLSCSESFWLDELQTYWVISSGPQEVARRSLETQGFSPLYYYLLWLLEPFMPLSEWALRLPSLIFVLLSILLIDAIAVRIVGPSILGIAGLALLAVDEVVNAALFARPYSMALFGAVLSTWILLRWLDFGTRRYMYAYVLALLLSIYGHFLFAGVILIHLIVIVIRRSVMLPRAQDLVVAAIYTLIGLVPLVPQIQLMLGKRHEMAISELPNFAGLLLHILPWTALLLLSLAFMLALGVVASGEQVFRHAKRFDWPNFSIFFAWSFLPLLLLFCLSHILGASVFVPRYFLWAAPGFALLGAFLFDFVQNEKLRQRFFVVALVLIIGAEGTKERFNEDWRGAISSLKNARVDKAASLLFYSGVAESARDEWLMDDIKRGQFSSPLSYYQLHDRNIVILPLHVVSAEAEPGDFWSLSVEPLLGQSSSIEVLCHDNLSWWLDGQRVSVCDEIVKRLAKSNLNCLERVTFGRVSVCRAQKQTKSA